jgi:hypothetical protein
MERQAKTTLARHRARMADQGFMRMEVKIRREDAALVRDLTAALSDPARREDTRGLLRRSLAGPAKTSLKALLASAPLEGIDLDRSPDTGRDIDL